MFVSLDSIKTPWPQVNVWTVLWASSPVTLGSLFATYAFPDLMQESTAQASVLIVLLDNTPAAMDIRSAWIVPEANTPALLMQVNVWPASLASMQQRQGQQSAWLVTLDRSPIPLARVRVLTVHRASMPVLMENQSVLRAWKVDMEMAIV